MNKAVVFDLKGLKVRNPSRSVKALLEVSIDTKPIPHASMTILCLEEMPRYAHVGLHLPTVFSVRRLPFSMVLFHAFFWDCIFKGVLCRYCVMRYDAPIRNEAG